MDEITKQWFDPSSVVVTRAPELVGWHDDEELVRLSGAPRGSHLDIGTSAEGHIELRVSNQDLLSEPLIRSIRQGPEGYIFEIQNAAFVLRPQFRGAGIGSRSVAIELHEALRLRYFAKVVVYAVGDWHHAGGPLGMNGYYVWARMGFDAPLPADIQSHPKLPASCKAAVRLVELMSSKEGSDFWLRHGRSVTMEFPLQEPSSSWARFRRYAQEHDIKVTS